MRYENTLWKKTLHRIEVYGAMDMMAIDIDTFLPVFSITMNFPSEEHSAIDMGPFALLWYVVLADISPFTTWLTRSDESKKRKKKEARNNSSIHALNYSQFRKGADLRPNK